MKKAFRLTGLECANCASKMETAIAKLPLVKSVSINFLTTKMVLEVSDDKTDEVLSAVAAVIKKFEPHVAMKKA